MTDRELNLGKCFRGTVVSIDARLYPYHPNAWVDGSGRSTIIAISLVAGSAIGMFGSLLETAAIRNIVPQIPDAIVFFPTYALSSLIGSSLGYRLGCRITDGLNFLFPPKPSSFLDPQNNS